MAQLAYLNSTNFGNGTKELAEAIAESNGFSIAGGGDTLAAIAKYQITDKVSYISQAAARLEFLEGKTPASGRNFVAKSSVSSV